MFSNNSNQSVCSQSDQSLSFPPEKKISPWLSSERQSKIRLCPCKGWSSFRLVNMPTYLLLETGSIGYIDIHCMLILPNNCTFLNPTIHRLFSTKIMVLRSLIHKTLIRTANCEDRWLDGSWGAVWSESFYCLSMPFKNILNLTSTIV